MAGVEVQLDLESSGSSVRQWEPTPVVIKVEDSWMGNKVLHFTVPIVSKKQN